MAYCRLVFLLVLSAVCLVHSVSSSGRVPVFLWGDVTKTSLKSSPLTGVAPEEFTDILKQELSEDPFCVVFIEETLSVEDLSLKNSEGVTSYPYLHENVPSSAYMPSVDSPMSVIDRIVSPDEALHVKLTENGLSAEIEAKKGKFLLINLNDAKEGESRAEFLRRHNDFMEDMVSKLKEHYSKVVAIYTAEYPSWTVMEHHRVRRATDNDNTYVFSNLLFRVSTITLKVNNNTVTLDNAASTAVDLNGTELRADLTFPNNKLSLYFTDDGSYWYFSKVEVTDEGLVEELEPESQVYSINGWSYRCMQSVRFASVNATKDFQVTFTNYKIQPFFAATNETLEFGDSLNCVGFFSVPIWSGLFVVFIMLLITFYGIMMMMDIRTMDRFDDPKGKTITINAAE